MNEGTTFKELHWVITGEFVTRMARDWVLERRWDDSIKWLKDSMEGMDYNHIMAILAGKSKLIGDSTGDILLTDEDSDVAEQYKKDYMFLYGGILHEHEKHYQPYAIVTDYGQNDVYTGSVEQRGYRCYVHNREMHYADNARTDKSFLLKYPNAEGIHNIKNPIQLQTLWKLVDRPPLWVACHTDSQKALDEYLHYHNRGLEIRGHSAWYPMNKENIERSKKESRKIWPLNERKLIREEERYQRQIKELHTQIVNQTKDWFLLRFEDKTGIREYHIPQEPFEHWALKRTSGYHLAPNWNVVSPSGFKMYADDPYHTDWVIGAEIPLDEIYAHDNRELDKAIYDLMRQVQADKLNFQCAILCGTGKIEGKTFHPKKNGEAPEGSIIVIPHASADYYKAMVKACAKGGGGIITETGGALCHLANEARQLGVRMAVIPDALICFPSGTKIIINCDLGRVHVSILNGHFLGAEENV